MNIDTDPGAVDIFPASRIPQNLHHLLEPIYGSTSVISRESLRPRGNMNEKGFRITTDPHTLSCVLQGAQDDKVTSLFRKTLFFFLFSELLLPRGVEAVGPYIACH